MRFLKVAPATLLALVLVLPALVAVSAAGGASLSIQLPGPGARVEPGESITLVYTRPGMAPGAHVAGEVRLDGALLATFDEPATGNVTEVRIVMAFPNGTSFGDHALEALAWTGSERAVGAGLIVDVEPVDAPPVLRNVSVVYDLAARTFRMRGVVEDVDDPLVLVSASVGANASRENDTLVSGRAFAYDFAYPDVPGTYAWRVLAVDHVGKIALASGSALIENQAPTIEVSTARHELGGYVVVEGKVSDPDGRVTNLTVNKDKVGIQENGTFRYVYAGQLAVGPFQLDVVAWDNLGGRAEAFTVLDVAPIHATVYDRIIAPGLRGAETNGQQVQLPQSVGATLQVLAQGAGTAVMRMPIVVSGNVSEMVVWPTVGPMSNGNTSWNYGSWVDIQWAAGPGSRVEIRIEGDFL